mmetsp:Transcript_98467/g.273931  ORF Transcript_98467/g.273931 Transcript_98467/m.273931 type:complete len:100 (-) Transcript_98467:472-771(-)
MACIAVAHAELEVDFHRVDAEASLTVPRHAGTIGKGHFVMLRRRPCKVVDVTVSKTGKHGHGKAHFVGADLFTGKKYRALPDVPLHGGSVGVPHGVSSQ